MIGADLYTASSISKHSDSSSSISGTNQIDDIGSRGRVEKEIAV